MLPEIISLRRFTFQNVDEVTFYKQVQALLELGWYLQLVLALRGFGSVKALKSFVCET